ncbi:Hydrogen cyanide synthase subunit HcnA [Roseovarius indicus]|uniref:Hydrogen cyanide synthase subunit HcnA n=2 Tax=Roseovarius indicus TaxID=540747 RepID=A0A5P3A7T3_9RHOB|nr:Hydrogen cyanide synthase subunit HcnA [Roseovarius indicus]SFE05048.1 2Fe-2S iron-sulfur cluster binding domain-containing protein [Roseovarius indicus]
MKDGSTMQRLDDPAALVQVRFDGTTLELAEGGNLAAELLAVGVAAFRRTPVSGAPRGPFCMMGACFDCLVEIDGVVRQACMTEVRDGIEISRPSAGAEVSND